MAWVSWSSNMGPRHSSKPPSPDAFDTLYSWLYFRFMRNHPSLPFHSHAELSAAHVVAARECRRQAVRRIRARSYY